MVNRRLIHVLGRGAWQVSTVSMAKSLGYRVLVTNIYTDRPAYALVDFHEVIDITDRGATLRSAVSYRIDGIVCETTDVGVPTAASVAERLGLPGIRYETPFPSEIRMKPFQDQIEAPLQMPTLSY